MKIMFICSGNTCRSPMAAALFEHSLTENQKENIKVSSAGIATFGGDSATEEAITVMKNMGIDISAHLSSSLKRTDLSDTDLFVCMTEAHRAVLLANGVSTEKIICLDISDPYGQGLEVYEECANEIKNKLQAVREKL